VGWVWGEKLGKVLPGRWGGPEGYSGGGVGRGIFINETVAPKIPPPYPGVAGGGPGLGAMIDYKNYLCNWVVRVGWCDPSWFGGGFAGAASRAAYPGVTLNFWGKRHLSPLGVVPPGQLGQTISRPTEVLLGGARGKIVGGGVIK